MTCGFLKMGRKSHVMVVPHPALGHVSPLMKLGCSLAGHGIKVTFVLTDAIHEKIESAMSESFVEPCPIRLVSIPQVWQADRDEQDKMKAMENALTIWRVHLQKLIEKANLDEPVTHVIADIVSGWALEIAKKMCIKAVAFVPFGAGNLALVLHAPKLIESGILDSCGIPTKEASVCLSEDIPPWNVNELFWSHKRHSEERQKFLFVNFFNKMGEYVRISDSLIVNSFYELEPSACDLIPDILPIGPLLASTHFSPFSANFWPEDSTCLGWLDKQPPRSVIYAAFGSTLVCNQQQLNEVAHGLEMTGRPFLWVVRSDFLDGKNAELPDAFLERIENYGKIVKWAPQEKVLAHPSIACFFSHCGWNSTMEGVSMGVPFLCWPYSYDQYHNRDYICEGWKVGVAVNPDDDGIVTRREIKTNIDKLLCDDNIKANSLKLKEMARKSTSEGGSSCKNFISFVEFINQ